MERDSSTFTHSQRRPRRGSALLAALAIAAALTLASAQTALAQAPPTYNPDNDCDGARVGAPQPASPGDRPVASLSAPRTQATVGVKVTLRTRVSLALGRDIRRLPQGKGFCGWHGDHGDAANYAFHSAGPDEPTAPHFEAHTYTRAGNYRPWIYVIDDAGVWSERSSVEFYVNALPVAAFTYSPDSPLTREAVTFTSTSTDEEVDGIVRQEWDLDGDGSYEASGASARRAYSTATTVRLRVTDKRGASSVSEQRVVIGNRAPAASFTYAPDAPVAAQTVSFDSTSIDPDGSVAGWQWDLDGDGAYDDAAGPSVSKTFTQGSHRVGLTVTDDGGSTATAIKEISVAVDPAGPPPAEDPAPAEPAPPASTAPPAAGPSSSPAAPTPVTPAIPATPAMVAAGAESGPVVLRAMATARRPRPAVRALVRIRAGRTRAGARVRLLTVGTESGARIRLRCKGRGCPGPETRRAGSRAVSFKSMRRTFRAGTVVEIRVTKPDAIGRSVRVTVQAGGVLRRADLCLAPGSIRPGAC